MFNQLISQKRMIIDPQAYIDINEDLLKRIYTEPELKKFKGYYLAAHDSSNFDLPNYLTIREDFGIEENTNHSKHTSTARVSRMVDVLNDFILSSTITGRKYSEVDFVIDY